jgi:uncharacterized caspase-like protein
MTASLGRNFGYRTRGISPVSDVALFFYLGHAVEVSSENYLLPVDFDGTDAATVRTKGLSSSDVLASLKRLTAKLNILIIDSCRDNPFGK